MYYDYSEVISELEEFLAQQLIELPNERAKKYAEEIIKELSIAKEFNKILRDAKTPARDIKNIISSKTQLERAIKSINDIGSIGQIALSKAVNEVYKHAGKNISASEIVDNLNEISEILKAAEKFIDEDDKGLIKRLSISGESYHKKTKPENWVAKSITEKAAKIFSEETGRKASLTTQNFRDDDEANGKFFIFLKGLFNILGIEASVEASIKKLVR